MTKKYWFARKTYGWGWVPCTVQGWLFTLGMILVLMACSIALVPNYPVWFVLILGLWVGVLFAVCLLKGPRPRWQWGEPNQDK